MRELMVSFNLDLNKMPLGRVRRQQILDGFQVLKQIQQKIENNASHESLIDSSNRFYSIIPHKASSENIIDSSEGLMEKAQMLQDLKNVQFTYDFLYKTGECGQTVLDDFYVKLNNVIEPLHGCKKFRIVKEAFDSTKSDQNCHIEQIFGIQRIGVREEKENGHGIFDGLENHRLLWHGTRITNVHQILTHGLKIAPAQAIAIGCSLGKGLYFSDAVAEAIKWCHTKESKNIGVILLYEVALGNSEKYFHSENVQLPDGHHSAHGVGETSPQSIERIDGEMDIHSGPMKSDCGITSEFEYNQFVVYNEQQAKLKYLVQWKNVSERRFMPKLVL